MTYTVDHLCSERGLRRTFDYLLPIARANTTITYGEIADKLAADLRISGPIFPIHVGSPVGTLMQRILKVDENAPLINILVVHQNDGQPGKGANSFLRERFHLSQPPTGQGRRELVDRAAQKVYAFRDWRRLYAQLFGLEPPPIDPMILIKGREVDGMPPASSKSRFGGPAESKEHLKLKEYVLNHPKKIGAPVALDDASKEKMLLSGDEVDVYMAKGNTAYLIEVKSVRSTEPDLLRGVFQCIKYRAVFKAQCEGTIPDIRIKMTLVVEKEPPSYIHDLATRHKVQVVVLAVNR
jgi:hypothetical protein